MREQRRGRRIAMTPEEVDAFLAEERTCRVATVGPDGPHATPLWYAWHGGALWLTSVVRSQRWTDLQRDPRVAVVVDAGTSYDPPPVQVHFHYNDDAGDFLRQTQERLERGNPDLTLVAGPSESNHRHFAYEDDSGTDAGILAGIQRFYERDYDGAIAQYRKVLELDPQNQTARNNLNRLQQERPSIKY
jgi:hypothetical protein